MSHSAYLTFTEYQAYGGTLPEASFTLLEFKSRKRIDYLTDSRVQNMAEVPEAVKLCMMCLISLENSVGVQAQAENPVVTSFSTDGYSESYGKALGVADADKSMNTAVREYLYGETDDDGVPLLYRGVYGY